MNTKEKCGLCNRKTTVKLAYSAHNFCDKHFLEYIEKRIRKEIRDYKLNTKKKYGIKKTNNHEYELTKYFLEKAFNNMLKIEDSEKGEIIPTSLDKEINTFLKIFIENKSLDITKIKPLRAVTDYEQKELCRILGLKYKNTTEKIPHLEELEENHPGTKFSVLKSLKSYEENLKKHSFKSVKVPIKE